MSRAIHIVIPGNPRPLERHRSRVITGPKGAYVQTYETAANKHAKENIAKHAIAALRSSGQMRAFDGPLHVTFLFAMERPVTRPKSRPMPDSKPDFDNCEKLVLDALNGVVWNDDAQITDWSGKKRYDPNPRTEIIVRPLTVAEAV